MVKIKKKCDRFGVIYNEISMEDLEKKMLKLYYGFNKIEGIEKIYRSYPILLHNILGSFFK